MNRWQGPRSRFRTEITRRAAQPCRVFNWVSAELAPHPYLYSYIWREGPFLVWPSTELLSDKLWEKSANYAKLCNLRWKNALTPKLNKVQKSCSCSTRGVGVGKGAWQLHSSPCQLQCFFPTTFSLASFRRLFPASPGESPKRIGQPAKSYDTPRRSAATATASASAAAPPVATFCMIYVPLGVARQLCTSSVRGVQACSVRCSGTCLFFFAKTFHFIA